MTTIRKTQTDYRRFAIMGEEKWAGTVSVEPQSFNIFQEKPHDQTSPHNPPAPKHRL